jgi:hypothetical protein
LIEVSSSPTTRWHAIEYAYDEQSKLYRKVSTRVITPFAVVLASDAISAKLEEALPCGCVRVSSSRTLANEIAKPGAIVFVEWDLLCHIDDNMRHAPIVALTDNSSETLPRMIRTLDAYPWLEHFMSEAMLDRASVKAHLARFVERIAVGTEAGLFGDARAARLARASHREARFDRIRTFFSERGVSNRNLDRIGEVCEELVTNALYDAPMEGGHFTTAVARTEDVDLPNHRACEISYGVGAEMVYLRVRDTFGALDRKRLLSVLTRCNTGNVLLDESRGGAGLGLWRVFSAATTISITVDPGHLTEIVVGIATKDRKANGPLSVDLYFTSRARRRRVTEEDLIDHSITIVRVA